MVLVPVPRQPSARLAAAAMSATIEKALHGGNDDTVHVIVRLGSGSDAPGTAVKKARGRPPKSKSLVPGADRK
jgi:hypothetical protein